MLSLREMQRACRKAFLFGADSELHGSLLSQNLPAATQIHIYQNNTKEIFLAALLSSYPVTARLVGEGCMRGLSLEYMRKYPSRSGDLQAFAGDFPILLDRHYARTRFAFLGDMARLEWLAEESMLEPEMPPVELHALARCKTEANIFERQELYLVPSCRLMQSDFPVLEIWRANQPHANGSANLDVGAQHVIIVRQDNDVIMQLLSPQSYHLAGLFHQGTTLSQSARRFIEAHPESDFAAALKPLLELGVLACKSTKCCEYHPSNRSPENLKGNSP